MISGLRGALSFTTAGTSNTASLPPVRATWMIIRPAGTTSPGSAPTRVIVPGASATSRVYESRFCASDTCARADSTFDSALRRLASNWSKAALEMKRCASSSFCRM